MRRGEVYWANLAARSGSEQSGRRPVLIVSHDGFNQTPAWRSLIIVPISSSEPQRQRGPTVVPLPAGAAALPRESAAICHQVTTLDRGKLGSRVGALTPEQLGAVAEALKAALDL